MNGGGERAQKTDANLELASVRERAAVDRRTRRLAQQLRKYESNLFDLFRSVLRFFVKLFVEITFPL